MHSGVCLCDPEFSWFNTTTCFVCMIHLRCAWEAPGLGGSAGEGSGWGVQRACQPTGIGKAEKQSSSPSLEYTQTQGATLAFVFFSVCASITTRMINMKTIESDMLTPISGWRKFGKQKWHKRNRKLIYPQWIRTMTETNTHTHCAACHALFYSCVLLCFYCLL